MSGLVTVRWTANGKIVREDLMVIEGDEVMSAIEDNVTIIPRRRKPIELKVEFEFDPPLRAPS